MLVDMGCLKYDDLVIKYWPEFGKFGKDNITIKMIVNHEAGLADIDRAVTLEYAKNDQIMRNILENQTPNWPPGEAIGYHIISYGWLIDQLIRRADNKGRGLAQFFAQEVAQKFDVDYYIGLPLPLNYRVARLITLNYWTKFKHLFNWQILKYYIILIYNYQPIQWKGWKNPLFLFRNNLAALNDPEIRRLELGSTNGYGTAQSLAKIFTLLNNGYLVKNHSLISSISAPLNVNKYDLILGINTTSGWGFYYSQSPTNTTLLGHMGYGGQGLKVDMEKNLVYVYLTNALSTEMGGFSETWKSFEQSVFKSLYP